MSIFEPTKELNVQLRSSLEETVAMHDLESIELSFLAKGKVHERSGINWGQREGRNPDQAYIPIPASIYKHSNFFPAKGQKFTVATDDGRSFIMVRRQDKGKALHTPDDNSILGKYLRKRLGLKLGQLVENVHFEDYGRTDVTFTKVDDETYFMDFSVND